jgi:hypothetical protein
VSVNTSASLVTYLVRLPSDRDQRQAPIELCKASTARVLKLREFRLRFFQKGASGSRASVLKTVRMRNLRKAYISQGHLNGVAESEVNAMHNRITPESAAATAPQGIESR